MAGAARYPWLAILASNVQTLLLAVSWFAARRQGRAFDAALALLTLARLVALPVSIHRIVGPVSSHMIHWMTLVSLLSLIVAGRAIWATVLIPLGRDGKTSRRIVLSTVGAAGLVVQAVLACAVVANLRDAWRRPERFRADDFDADNGVVALAEATRAALHADGAGDCLVRIVDHDAWTIAAELVVRLTKAGCRVSVDAEWELSFGPQHARRGPPQGTLLVCKAAADAGPRAAPWKLVGRTPAATLFWRPAAAVAEGRGPRAEGRGPL